MARIEPSETVMGEAASGRPRSITWRNAAHGASPRSSKRALTDAIHRQLTHQSEDLVKMALRIDMHNADLQTRLQPPCRIHASGCAASIRLRQRPALIAGTSAAMTTNGPSAGSRRQLATSHKLSDRGLAPGATNQSETDVAMPRPGAPFCSSRYPATTAVDWGSANRLIRLGVASWAQVERPNRRQPRHVHRR
jgi:hypothetical protein